MRTEKYVTLTECKFTTIPHGRNIERVHYQKDIGVHYHAEWYLRCLTYLCLLSYIIRGRIEFYPNTYWLVYDTVITLNGCSTTSTKASIIMVSDNCDLMLITGYGTVQYWMCAAPQAQKASTITLRDNCDVLLIIYIHIYRSNIYCVTVCEGESKITLILVTVYDTVATLNQYSKYKGVHRHAEW